MDWLLREIGYANVAVFLAADDGVFQLGAYMKYTVAGETLVTDALRRVIVPMAVKDAVAHFPGKTLSDRLTSAGDGLLKGQDVLAVNCTYLGESLASIVFFRDESQPLQGRGCRPAQPDRPDLRDRTGHRRSRVQPERFDAILRGRHRSRGKRQRPQEASQRKTPPTGGKTGRTRRFRTRLQIAALVLQETV